MKKIAIIIPAYKRRFLERTLCSIVQQTHTDFRVYIGDDASPEQLEEIVAPFRERMDLVYHRFDTNLGGRNLTGHWERCIALSQNEPLIWLFSDDDLMPSDGVQRVIAAWDTDRLSTPLCFYRFPLIRVDENEQLISRNPIQSPRVTGYEFLLDKLSCRISSAACEYVFSRDLWNLQPSFVPFPLAWCSDDATWTRLAEQADGLQYLPGEPVCWRNAAGSNISNSSRYNAEKAEAVKQFLAWIYRFYPTRRNEPLLLDGLEAYLCCILRYSLNKQFDNTCLWKLSAALWKFSPRRAIRLWMSHVRYL